MDLLSYAFNLGIVFITFHALWWVILFFLKQIIGPENPSKQAQAEAILKPIGLILVVGLASQRTIEFITAADSTLSFAIYTLIGTLLVYVYLLEKLRKTKVQFGFANGKMQSNMGQQSKSDKVLLYVLTVVFIGLLFFPQVLENPLLSGLGALIKDIYSTAIIGWILKIIAFFFVVRMIFIGAIAGSQLANRKKNNPNGYDSNDEFVDYEIVEDDEDDTQQSDNEPKQIDIT